MATAEQLKALMRAHFDDDSEKIKTVVLRIAANEERCTLCPKSIISEIWAVVDTESVKF